MKWNNKKAKLTQSRLWLLEEFRRKQEKNKKYSLRAFSKALGISPGRLSELLSGKRTLTLKLGNRIADRLGLNVKSRSTLLECIEVERALRWDLSNALEISSFNITFDVSQMLFLKEAIKEFQCYLSTVLEGKKASEHFRLSTQLIPIEQKFAVDAQEQRISPDWKKKNSAMSYFNVRSKAKEVRVVFGQSLAPYVFDIQHTGYEVEIYREALKYKGHVLVPKYVPLERVPYEIEAESVDAIQRDNSINFKGRGLYHSQETIRYHNAIIWLKDSSYHYLGPHSLRGRSLLAFQGAQLAPPYQRLCGAAITSDRYEETPDQFFQVKCLFEEKVDFILCDKYIFNFYSTEAMKIGNKIRPVHICPVGFGGRRYFSVFRDRQLRDDFDEGLAAVQGSGKIKELRSKFLKSMYVNPIFKDL